MVSASGRPEEDTSFVSGLGLFWGVFGACGFWVCVRALRWSDSGCQSSPVLGFGFGVPGAVCAWPAGWLVI